MTLTIVGCPTYKTYIDPVIIELPHRGWVNACIFEKPVTVKVERKGMITNNLFRDDVTIETPYEVDPEDRKFSTNIYHKNLTIKGAFEVQNNFNPSLPIRGSEQSMNSLAIQEKVNKDE